MTTKFRGWIEKLYVDSTGKQVHKGETLFEIYSPELYSAQNEYVLALNQAGGSGLKASARQKLKSFDVSEDQIAELEKTRQPQRTLRVNAPIDGIVVEKMAVQGQMVEAGMKLYRLADLVHRLGAIPDLRTGLGAAEVRPGSGSESVVSTGP